MNDATLMPARNLFASVANQLRKVQHKAVVFVLIASLFLAMPRATPACGPFFTDAVFVFTKHPDFPLDQFAKGQIGILQTTYARSYLVTAYRYLTNAPLSDVEQKGVADLWNARLNYEGELDDSTWIKTWTAARAKVAGLAAPAEIHAFRNHEKPHEYESFLNCQGDAFSAAASTLEERIKHFGADSAQVRDWVAAQDTVFANCSEGKHIPDPASANADALVRADRSYQIAAANFYSGGFDEARQQFDAIANDRNSPWQNKGGYLAARAMLRKGSLADKDDEKTAALSAAESQLRKVLGDQKLSPVHHDAEKLLNLVKLRLRPQEKLHELAHTISKADASRDFKQDVWDYTKLLDDFIGDDSDDSTKKPVPAELRSEDVTDWVVSFQDGQPGAMAHAVERWEKTHELPWLVAAISKAEANDPRANALLTAAAAIDHSSPAFATLTLHSARLLMDAKRNDEARKLLDQTLSTERAKLPASAVNLLLSLRMKMALNLDEFLQTAQRRPSGFSDNSDGREIPDDENGAKEFTKEGGIFFDLDAVNAFNQTFSVALLKDAALAKGLPPNLRRDVTQAAFMRAALLDHEREALQLLPALQGIYPQLKPYLESYQKAATPPARLFAANYLALKFPGLRPWVTSGVGRSTALAEIDSFRDNWWCAEAPSSVAAAGSDGEGDQSEKPKKPKPAAPPEFAASSLPVAARQLAALQALGSAPDYLCRMVIEWANKNPADPRVPEALHLAVKSTRYGCTDKETGKWSKAAYDLLQQRYKNTTWAKQTKYWFKE